MGVSVLSVVKYAAYENDDESDGRAVHDGEVMRKEILMVCAVCAWVGFAGITSHQ